MDLDYSEIFRSIHVQMSAGNCIFSPSSRKSFKGQCFSDRQSGTCPEPPEFVRLGIKISQIQ